MLSIMEVIEDYMETKVQNQDSLILENTIGYARGIGIGNNEDAKVIIGNICKRHKETDTTGTWKQIEGKLKYL